MIFCSLYFFISSAVLNQFVENPGPISFWYRLDGIGLVRTTTKKLPVSKLKARSMTNIVPLTTERIRGLVIVGFKHQMTLL